MKKRSDGRYAKQVTISVVNGKPKKKTVYGKTIKEVEKNYRDLMLKVDRGILIKDNSMTFTELKNEWYYFKIQGKVKKNSELSYSSILATIDSTLGYNQIKNITPYLIQTVLDDIQIKQGLGCKAKMYLYLVSTIFKYGMQKEYIYKNPCIGLNVKYKPKTKRILTNEEKDKINKCHLPLRELTLLYILRYTGIRRGELFALCKSDINKKDMYININKTLLDNKGKPVVQQSAKTEAGNRNIPILVPLAKCLFQYIDSIDSEYLFLNKSGNFCAVQTMRNTLNKVIKEVGIGEDITYHVFRHNFISECYIAGVSVKKLQNWVGHVDVSTTLNIYTHLDAETLNDCNELNQYYSGSQTKVKYEIKKIV